MVCKAPGGGVCGGMCRHGNGWGIAQVNRHVCAGQTGGGSDSGGLHVRTSDSERRCWQPLSATRQNRCSRSCVRTLHETVARSRSRVRQWASAMACGAITRSSRRPGSQRYPRPAQRHAGVVNSCVRRRRDTDRRAAASTQAHAGVGEQRTRRAEVVVLACFAWHRPTLNDMSGTAMASHSACAMRCSL